MTEQVRQGDVLLIPITEAELPKNLKPVARRGGRLIIAEGEVTGHAHAISSPRAKGFVGSRWNRGPTTLFILVTGDAPVPVDHEEHGVNPVETRVVDPGWHRYVPQGEFDPVEGWRPVLD